ncbi:MAG: hypothetical protein ACJ8HJ_08595 [Massilia sp.]
MAPVLGAIGAPRVVHVDGVDFALEWELRQQLGKLLPRDLLERRWHGGLSLASVLLLFFDFYQKLHYTVPRDLQILSHIGAKNRHRRRSSSARITSHPAFSTVHRSVLASISRPLYSAFIAARNHACRHEGE